MTPDLVLPAKVITACAVYGWFRGDKYLYIGQSISTIRRLKKHQTIKDIQIKDEFHVWYCSESELNKFEGQLIRHFKPTYNIVIPQEKGKRKYNTFREAAQSKENHKSNTRYNGTQSRISEEELDMIKKKYGYELPKR